MVRLVARDDPRQFAVAEQLLAEPVLVLPTVMLETIWVLRTIYELPPRVIGDHLRRILGLPTVRSDSRELLWALDRFEAGADFADMFHLALAAKHEATSFATFDRKIGGKAGEQRDLVEHLE